jgi:hypothetical protein
MPRGGSKGRAGAKPPYGLAPSNGVQRGLVLVSYISKKFISTILFLSTCSYATSAVPPHIHMQRSHTSTDVTISFFHQKNSRLKFGSHASSTIPRICSGGPSIYFYLKCINKRKRIAYFPKLTMRSLTCSLSSSSILIYLI